jgi:deoxyribonuclease IV
MQREWRPSLCRSADARRSDGITVAFLNANSLSCSTPLVLSQRLCYGGDMPILGAHKSIASGYDKAVERAHRSGCQCVQLFTKNNSQWAARDIAATDAQGFRDAMQKFGITHPLAHDAYLINLASPDPRFWKKSVDALIVELHRAEMLGIPYVVTHPGAFTTSDETTGLGNIIRALDEVSRQTRRLLVRCLLETTAGQGTSLGWRFEQMAAILDGVKAPGRLGFCFDTCHVFAAGYPLSTRPDYEATMAAFDRLLGLDRIKAFHLNDSRGGLGSRVDRHEHIGRGKIGIEAFRHLLNDPRFRAVPMYLETPKKDETGKDWDAVNLRVLHGCIKKAGL